MAKMTRKRVKAPPAQPAPAAKQSIEQGRQASAVVRGSLDLLRAKGPFVPFGGGNWGPKGSKKGIDGKPATCVRAFVIEILVRNGQAEFSKFRKVRDGQVAVEVKAK